jgi:uncharacterized membrane protein YdjX (TVP38/TMEM64 family)
MQPESSFTTPPPGVFRRLGASGPVAIALSFWPPLGGFILLAFLTRLGPWLRLEATTGLWIYLLVAGGLIGISFVPTFACAILAGWTFGFAVGWPLAMAAITAGSVVAYAIARWIARERVLEVVQSRPRWNAIYRDMLGTTRMRTTVVITLLRIPPTSPFALTNFALAAARVPLREYIIGTVVGIAPRTAMAALAGAQLEQLRFKDVGQSWSGIASVVATIVVCVVLGIWANRALRLVGRLPAPADLP